MHVTIHPPCTTPTVSPEKCIEVDLLGRTRGGPDRADLDTERHARSVAALDALVKAAQMLGRGAEAHAAAEKYLKGER